MMRRRQQSESMPARRSERGNGHVESGEQERVRGFRRNQTITGSSSRFVTSSNELNASMVSPRAHVHHLVRHRRKLWLRMVLVIIALLATYLLVSQTVATVSIRVTGDANLTKERQQAYERRIDDYLSIHPFERLHPNMSMPELLAFLQAKYPEIRKVSVRLSGEFGKAQASVSLREASARWVVDGAQRYVDSTGVVFAYNAYSTPSIEIIDENDALAASRKAVTSERFLQFVGTSVGAMKHYGYTVSRARIPAFSTRQLELRVKGKPYDIKMYIDRAAGEQAEDASRVIRYLQKKGIRPDYIDVRIENKAFYK